MRFSEIINEITRRDFLKGAGATAGLAMMPNVAQSAETEWIKIKDWNFTIKKSKFDRVETIAVTDYSNGGALIYNGNSLYYYNGTGEASSNFQLIAPGSLVRYIIDDGKILSTVADANGNVVLTNKIPLLLNAKKIEFNFNIYNRIRRTSTSGAETTVKLDGFDIVVKYFNQPEKLKSIEQVAKDQEDSLRNKRHQQELKDIEQQGQQKIKEIKKSSATSSLINFMSMELNSRANDNLINRRTALEKNIPNSPNQFYAIEKELTKIKNDSRVVVKFDVDQDGKASNLEIVSQEPSTHKWGMSHVYTYPNFYSGELFSRVNDEDWNLLSNGKKTIPVKVTYGPYTPHITIN